MSGEFNAPDGQIYSLAHVKAQNHEIQLTISGTVYFVPVTAIFSNHCYTDGKDGTISRNDPWFFTTDGQGNRAFCPSRWQASLELPVHVAKMIEERLHCQKVNKSSSYVRVHDPSKFNPYEGWYIFFNFDRPKEGSRGAIRISIKSHHYRTSQPDSIRSGRQLRFHAALALWISERPDILVSLAQVPQQAVA